MRLSLLAECTLRALEYFAGARRAAARGHRAAPDARADVLGLRLGPDAFRRRPSLAAAPDSGLAHCADTDRAGRDAARVRVPEARAADVRATPEAERGFARRRGARARPCAMSSYGAFVNRHDVAGLLPLRQLLEPLRSLAPLIAPIADTCALGVDRVTGRDLGDRMLANVQALVAAPGLSDVLRFGAAGVNVYMQAIEDVRRGRARAFSLITDRAARGRGGLPGRARALVVPRVPRSRRPRRAVSQAGRADHRGRHLAPQGIGALRFDKPLSVSTKASCGVR